MSALGITADSSFDDYCAGLETFKTETELYGSEAPKVIIPAENLYFR